MFSAISVVILFIIQMFLPLILLTIKGYGLITGIPATNSLSKLVYILTTISFLLLLALFSIPWGKIFNLFHTK